MKKPNYANRKFKKAIEHNPPYMVRCVWDEQPYFLEQWGRTRAVRYFNTLADAKAAAVDEQLRQAQAHRTISAAVLTLDLRIVDQFEDGGQWESDRPEASAGPRAPFRVRMTSEEYGPYFLTESSDGADLSPERRYSTLAGAKRAARAEGRLFQSYGEGVDAEIIDACGRCVAAFIDCGEWGRPFAAL